VAIGWDFHELGCPWALAGHGLRCPWAGIAIVCGVHCVGWQAMGSAGIRLGGPWFRLRYALAELDWPWDGQVPWTGLG
jgi:hypothetical protein